MIRNIPSILDEDATHIAVIVVAFDDGGDRETFIVRNGSEAECDELLKRAADAGAIPYRGPRVPMTALYETKPIRKPGGKR